MKTARIVVDRDYVISRVDPRLYGAFVEHLGRVVYGGLYQPGHPCADAEGFRQDVLKLVRQIGVPICRYPGGNFVSGFDWEDSVGPDRRPSLNLAWNSIEPNTFGLHEFCSWAEKAGSEVLYAVNLGTRGLAEALDLLEYANVPNGTARSKERIRNGAKEPFGIKLWCLGNEMDGPWQMGHKTAYEYGRTANEAAKMMKWVDPTIEVVACGSASHSMPTYGAWEYEMLNECYENVDYVSLHRYYGNPSNNTPDFLARSMDLDDFIREVVSICDAVGGRKHAKKKLNLSFDEWNVWYHSSEQDKEVWKADKWGRALPLLEDVYNFEDALLAGAILITFLKNADRVKVACLAQLVNVIAPIMTRNGGGAWAQTIYWPMMHASKYGRGTSLRPVLSSPVYDCADYEKVPLVDAAATLGDDGSVTIFAINRDLQEDITLACDLRAFGDLKPVEHIVLHHDDVKAINTEDNPNEVAPVKVRNSKMDDGRMNVKLPALSWNVIRLSK